MLWINICPIVNVSYMWGRTSRSRKIKSQQSYHYKKSGLTSQAGTLKILLLREWKKMQRGQKDTEGRDREMVFRNWIQANYFVTRDTTVKADELDHISSSHPLLKEKTICRQVNICDDFCIWPEKASEEGPGGTGPRGNLIGPWSAPVQPACLVFLFFANHLLTKLTLYVNIVKNLGPQCVWTSHNFQNIFNDEWLCSKLQT